LERLLKLEATGLIATHDLSLCEVADRIPEVQNFFFDAEIREGNLHFDYCLKPGVCSNMNASFLLRKLGVVEKEIGKGLT
jgi:DNA mismatch repair ATPase MutS